MKKRSLLDAISPQSLKKMIPCFQPTVRWFGKGEEILLYHDEEPDSIAILMKGRAILEVINAEGDSFLLDHYREGDVFGELFSLPLKTQHYLVTATEPSQVVFIDYQHVITPCENICHHHTQLISNLFVMTAQKTQELTLHLSLLNQKGMREKLLNYLRFARAQAETGEQASFQIPMTLSQLAEYLCVDRSAMSREIKTMKEDGLIENDKRWFKLLV